MKTHLLVIIFLLIIACNGKTSNSNVEAPGAEKSDKTILLETGANILQDKTPLKKISMYLDGFHFYNGNIKGQMEAHHYCTKLNEDVTQCIIYDGNGENAKIMGIEYIISAKLFKTLPLDERLLWHSHVHEVKSGTLVAPGLPDVAEQKLMEEIINTYGKTIHTWHTDHLKELPTGIPQIMMAFTKDGQLFDSLVQNRDKKFNISTAEKRENRKYISLPVIIEGADQWQQGKVKQLTLSDGADMAH